MTAAHDILAKGLLAGFAGKSVFGSSERGGFSLTSSEVSYPDENAHYIDQWIGKQSGGGQEIARSGDTVITRVYAGGTVSEEILSGLGIRDSDIMAYLKEKLIALSGVTRLSKTVEPITDGDWKYTYDIVSTVFEIGLSIGKETIWYKDTAVFTHVFLMTLVV